MLATDERASIRYLCAKAIVAYREKTHRPETECNCSRKVVIGLVMDLFEEQKLTWPKCLKKLKNSSAW
jgi:hypothetical protein